MGGKLGVSKIYGGQTGSFQNLWGANWEFQKSMGGKLGVSKIYGGQTRSFKNLWGANWEFQKCRAGEVYTMQEFIQDFRFGGETQHLGGSGTRSPRKMFLKLML